MLEVTLLVLAVERIVVWLIQVTCDTRYQDLYQHTRNETSLSNISMKKQILNNNKGLIKINKFNSILLEKLHRVHDFMLLVSIHSQIFRLAFQFY